MATPNVLALSAMTPTVIVSAQITVTTDSAVYTVPSGKAVKVAQGSICNTSASAVTVGLSVIPSGGTSDGTHKVIPDAYSLAAYDTLPLNDYIGGHMLGDGDKIFIHAGTANVLDVVISGVVMG